MQKILITGGAGFIGSELAWYLKDMGHDVFIIDNLSFGYLDNLTRGRYTWQKFKCLDVCSTEIKKFMEDVDVIFHFAGISSLPVCQEQPMLAYNTNTSAVANILDCARQVGVKRIIFSSTSAVYENNIDLPFSETSSVLPDLVYSTSKHMAENICKNYTKNYNMDIVIARFFNVYGPHQDIQRISPPFTSYLIKEVMSNKVPILYNSGVAQRDYIHVSDVINLLIKIMNSTIKYKADVFNVCTQKGYSVPELVKILEKITNKSISPIYKNPANFWDAYPILFTGTSLFSRERLTKEVTKHCIGNNSLACNCFEWQPTTDIYRGFLSIIKEFEKWQY
jgi:UDP-glucose 4-epimerase